MILLSREESLRWHGRHSSTQSENPLDDSEGLFENEDDEVVVSGGVPLPRWLVTGFDEALPVYTSEITSKVQAGNLPAEMSSVPLPQKQMPQLLFATKMQPSKPVLMHKQSQPSNSMQTISCSNSAVPLCLSTQSYTVPVSTPSTLANRLNTINPYDMINTNQDPASGFCSTVLHTPQLFNTATETLLMNENQYSILTQLQIQESDRSGPLYKEAFGLEPTPKSQKGESEPSKEQESTSKTSDNNNLVGVIM